MAPVLTRLGQSFGFGASAGSDTPISATGGTKATPGDGYVYHHWTTPGSFVITNAGSGSLAQMDVLMVGGGGGGAYDRGGGGGAGAFRPETWTAIAGTHPITCPATAATGGNSTSAGFPGGTTTFTYGGTAYEANGGGRGGGTGGPGAGSGQASPGNGSGGGAGGNPSYSGGASGDYGHPGKQWYDQPTGDPSGGAGGGAGVGVSPTYAWPYAFEADPAPGAPVANCYASDGKTLPWIPTDYGQDGWFAGGGAGGGGAQGPAGGYLGMLPVQQKAGAGRAGASQPQPALPGAAGTGSGGGGGYGGGPGGVREGGNGGTGAVLIRYPV